MADESVAVADGQKVFLSSVPQARVGMAFEEI